MGEEARTVEGDYVIYEIIDPRITKYKNLLMNGPGDHFELSFNSYCDCDTVVGCALSN